ncbi:MAG: MFS transporter [Acidimicrobiaceae bacterium]|nr:MFS transporter [Acidimicrobiaceae bacterium]
MSPSPVAVLHAGGGASERVGSRRQRRILLGALCLSLFITAVDSTVLNVALPTIGRDLHAGGVSGLQWTIDAYSLVLASLLLLAGSTGDRLGRRKMFQIGLVLFGLGSLACALAPNLGSLVAFRMLQAVGGSLLQPNALSILTNVFTDRRERAQAIGIWGGVFGIAAAFGPIIGGFLVDSVGWRAIFLVNLPVVVTAFVLLARNCPESRAARARRVDPPGQLLILAALATITFAIIEGPQRGWGSPVILGLFGFGVLALVAFVLVEQRRREPLVELRFFRSPPFSGAASMATLAFLILSGFLFLNTIQLQEVRGYSALLAGVAMLPTTVVMAFGSPVTGFLVARRGPRIPLVAAGLAFAAGAFILTRTGTAAPYLILAVAYVLLGAGFALVNPPITNTAVAGMPLSQSGVASAVASSARQLGNVLGVALIGSLTASRLRAELTQRAASAQLPAVTQHALAHASFGATGLSLPSGLPGAEQADALIRTAFTVAGHAGWALAAASGLAITAIALLTTTAAARARAERVLAEG